MTVVYPEPEKSASPATSSKGPEPFRIAETFTSRQGEGLLTGANSFFIRTSGCNLRCWFCDTPYASWNPEGDRYTIDELIDAARQSGTRHVVLTGGEPLIARGVRELTARLRGDGFHVTIETAGTVNPCAPCDLLSLSPKLAASGPDASKHPAWARRHETRRQPIETMRRLIDEADDHQVKFVVQSLDESGEMLTLLSKLDVAPEKTWIMPEGTTTEALDVAAMWLRPWTDRHGFNYCDRMHVRWYGNRRGT